MNGKQFITKIRRLGRKNSVTVNFNPAQGKGSHGTLFYGSRRTTVKDRKKDLGIGLLNSMCHDLGITKEEL